MGVVDWSLLEEITIPDTITALAHERIEAKKNKDYSRADAIRKEIEDAGFVLIDTKEGFVIEKK